MRFPFGKLAICIAFALLSFIAFGYEATLAIILLLIWGLYQSDRIDEIAEREQQRKADVSDHDSRNISA
jgi:hypothetical protein